MGGVKHLALPVLAVLLSLPVAAEPTRHARIANGVPTHTHATTGAMLVNGFQGCSGTLVGCRTFLTAAHCVCSVNGASCDPDESAFHVFLQHAGLFTVEEITPHPGYVMATLENDIAVFTLTEDVNGIAPTPLASASPPFGSAGTIVGFGTVMDAPQTGSGIKRMGEIVTADCRLELGPGADNDLLVCWDFDTPSGPAGTDSNTCPGDSGGPLFTDEGGTEVIAGVTSFGIGPCASDDFSGDTNVAHHAAWVGGVAGADLANASCGALPQVGEPAVRVDGFDGTLPGTAAEALHSFTIPAGTTDLRVVLNGQDDGPEDFDLWVRFGTPPSESANDCASESGSQFEVCHFSDPAPGTWYATARSWTGSGEYQVTATAFTQAACGDGAIGAGESCDDGNTVPGDGCDASCQTEPVCGDGVIEGGETCDDGNTVPGDGCDASCTAEVVLCGDGVRQLPEECDDGNTTSGDGCSAACVAEASCGDGVVDGTEQCDDGNTVPGDGCDADCRVEPPPSGCPALPEDTCLAPLPDGSKLTLKAGKTPDKNKLSWKWKALPTGAVDFGDPLVATDYHLCLYDEVAGTPALVLEATAPAGPLWSANSKGFKFKGNGGSDELKQLKIRSGSKLKLTAKGKGIALPALPVAQDGEVRLQVRSEAGGCWEGRYEAPASKSDGGRFVDRSTE